MLTQIRKRTGEIVPFDLEKMKRAIGAAFAQVRGRVDHAVVEEVAHKTVVYLEARFGSGQSTPSVEDVQNFVEVSLMAAGHMDVAKAYIIYRHEHAKARQERQEETIQKAEQGELYVTKRNGSRERFSKEKLKTSLSYAVRGFESVIDVEAIVKQCRAELYEDISTADVSRALILVSRSMIERDPAYSTVATRLLHDSICKDIIGRDVIDYKRFDEQYREAFVRCIKRGVEIGKLDPRMLIFNLEALAQMLVPKRDDLLQYLGYQTLADRYFLQDPENNIPLETPQFFWMRVAMGHALTEKEKHHWTKQFYEVCSTMRYVSSTPTLFHAGTTLPQLSSCYLTTIDDSLDHIFKCVGDNAQLSKWSGGIGNDWTNLRGTGAVIKGTGVESQGVIPFLKIANDTTVAINRSGRRRGATCAYLEVWHYDYEDFLELRRNTGDDRRRTHDMNTASWIPDLFMKRVQEDGSWTLFSPDEAKDLHSLYGRAFEEKYQAYEQKARDGEMRLHKTLRAKELWRKMISMLFETGHPWMTFKDPCNVRSPQDHCGVINSSNLCTEITLNTSAEETAVCNLGSINLERHLKDGVFDEALIEETVTISMRMLDNVIDINFYPTKEGERSNMLHRPVGLGVRGWQDALYMMNIPFDSDQAVALADESMELIAYHAINASAELAKERGAYASFRGSKWDRGLLPQDTLDLLEKERGQRIEVTRGGKLDWTPVREKIRRFGMRNSNTLAIAPTATTANITGCVPTVEPIYKNIYVKSNMSGEFMIVNEYLVQDLKACHLWNDEMLSKIKQFDGNLASIPEIPEEIRAKYKEAFDIQARWLIDAAAARGKWIDQSQSINLFYKGDSGRDLSDMYLYAWEKGLKTTYYLRTVAASGVEKSTVDLQQSSTPFTTKTGAEAEMAQVKVASAVSPVPGAAMAPVMEEPSLVRACSLENPDCESCQG